MEPSVNRTIAPEVHDFGRLTLPPISQVKLPNGITLHTANGGDNDVSRITFILPGGENESPDAMLSSIVMSSLQEGTQQHTGEQISNLLEYNGAWISGAVTTHHSLLTLHSLNSRLAEVLPLMAEMILTPSFQPDTISAILKRHAAKLEVDREKVTYHSGEAMRRIIYGANSPMARRNSPEQLFLLTPEKMSAYHHSRLAPSGIHVLLAGKITPEVMELVMSDLSVIPPGKDFELKPLVFPSQYESVTEKVDRPGSLQSSVKMMIPSIGRTHSDYEQLRAAVTAFGGYFGSRLMMNIREDKGLTYGISSSLIGYKNRSFILINTQTDCTKVPQVIEEIYMEITRLKTPSSYTDDEIKRLSRFQLSNLAAVLDTPFTVMDMYQTGITAGTPPDYFDRQQRIAHSLTPELLADTAQRYFDTSQLCTVIAGA